MSTREIHNEVLTFEVDGIGKVLSVVPVIPDDAPYRIREGIARRRIATTTGKCPCGARLDFAAAFAAGATNLEVKHENLCPAVTDRLAKEIRKWAR